MKWYGHPVLKFRTSDKLHISKEPGFASWATLFSITSFGIAVDYYVIPGKFFFFHIIHSSDFFEACLERLIKCYLHNEFKILLCCR